MNAQQFARYVFWDKLAKWHLIREETCETLGVYEKKN